MPAKTKLSAPDAIRSAPRITDTAPVARAAAPVARAAGTTPPRLNAFSGLKVLAVLGIIACHMGAFPKWDLCARMVEVLFLLSGFCMAYNHHRRTPDTPRSPAAPVACAAGTAGTTGWQIVKSKLPVLYPVHLTTFLLQLFFVATWSAKPLKFILSFGALNLTLQHAWFPETQFMFNNVSWFLSALLFCYLITPTLSRVAFRAETGRRLFLLFALLVAVRLYIEYMRVSYPAFIWLNLHACPLVQALNYSLGFIAGVWFINRSPLNTLLQERLSAAQMTLLEVLLISLYLTCCYTLIDDVYRLFFILLALPVIYLLAFGRGGISKALSWRPLRRLETINLEVFMFHSFILYHYPVSHTDPWYYAKFALITFTIAASFHWLTQQIRRRVWG